MGFSSVLESQPLQTHKMKFLVALCLVASAMAIEDTVDVAAAKASFAAAFAAAEAGEHALLAPKPVEALPVPALPAPVAPAAVAPAYYGGYYPYAGFGVYPYAGYAAYPYAGYNAYPYHY